MTMSNYKTGNEVLKIRVTRKEARGIRTAGAMLFLTTIVGLTLLHYASLGVVLGSNATRHWAQETFKIVAFAPTKIVSPLTSKAYAQSIASQSATATQSASPTKRDIIFSQKHGDIIYRIWGLESSFGQQPFLFCTHQGEVSDMGYNVLNHQCFSSFTEEVQTVDKWVEDHKDMPLGKMLCLYNQGNPKISCEYAQNFLGL